MTMPTTQMSHLQRLQLTLTCIAIAANTLCAGGVFTFPLLAETLASQFKLTQPQITSIVLAGMIGQYPLAALVGKAIDRYGPWACSFAASFLYFLGFGLFGQEIKSSSEITTTVSSKRLVFFFFLCGLATTLSFFSALFAASKNFPRYSGIASGTSMSLFSLSPLFLSVLASAFFTNSKGVLDIYRFVTFLAILAGSVHFIDGFLLRTPMDPVLETIEASEPEVNEQVAADEDAMVAENEDTDERVPLVSKPSITVEVNMHPVDASHSTLDLCKDPYFWISFVVILLLVGSCEMVMANIGSIVASLPRTLAPESYSSTSAETTATQIRLISISNTVTRLVIGPIADFASPIALYDVSGTITFGRRHHVSRIAFLAAPCVLLILTFGWMDIGIRSHRGLWALSVGTGVTYGMIFPVLPSILSSIWGYANLGRNFGFISYAAFIGTPIFSYLFAFVASSHQAKDSDVCRGLSCWQFTFALSTVSSAVALICTLILWRRWSGKL